MLGEARSKGLKGSSVGLAKLPYCYYHVGFVCFPFLLHRKTFAVETFIFYVLEGTKNVVPLVGKQRLIVVLMGTHPVVSHIIPLSTFNEMNFSLITTFTI